MTLARLAVVLVTMVWVLPAWAPSSVSRPWSEAAGAAPASSDRMNRAVRRGLPERIAIRSAASTTPGQQSPRAEAAADASRLAHSARLEAALALAAEDNPGRDDEAALAALDSLASEPLDFSVGAARIAKASILVKQGAEQVAAVQMQGVLEELLALRRARVQAPPATPLDADVAAIRALVFRPTGDLPLLENRRDWNAFSFPASLPPFVVVRADLPVVAAGGDAVRRTVFQRFPGIPRTLLFTSDELALLERLPTVLGGVQTRLPGSAMQVPHQPVGGAMAIATFWNRFFPTRQAHWTGWVLETYPIVTQVEFLDTARTRANARVTIGYSGATIVLEKVGGRWKVVGLGDEWIT